MSDQSRVLEYATPDDRVAQRSYWWLLPALWLPGAISSRIWYGDEYGIYGFSNLPALIVASPFGIERIVLQPLGLAILLAVGAGLMGLIGWIIQLLARGTVARQVFLGGMAAFAIIGMALLIFALRDAGTRRHFPYVLIVVYCWSIYLASAVALMIALCMWTPWFSRR